MTVNFKSERDYRWKLFGLKSFSYYPLINSSSTNSWHDVLCKSHPRDSSGRVPYLVSRDKSVRDSYRRFMGQWPQLHDYSQTQIPSPLTDDMERQRREKVRN